MDALKQQSETPTAAQWEASSKAWQKNHEEALEQIDRLERELAEARREIVDLRAQIRELTTGETD